MAIRVETHYSLSDWSGRRVTFNLWEACVGLMPVMSEWVQANMSILSKTWRNCSFSSSDKRELTYVCLAGPPKSIDSKGFIANSSLSSLSARAANYDCYSGDCDLVVRFLGLAPFSRSRTDS